MNSLAVCLALLSATAAAKTAEADLPSLSTGEPRPGWSKGPTSLILYDSSGTVLQEISLKEWAQEVAGERVRRIGKGAASSDGRFAWAWEQIGSTATFRFLGTTGRDLWRDDQVASFESIDPAALSADGETVLVLERDQGTGIAAVYDYIGQRLLEAREAGPIEFATFSPRGLFALVRWHSRERAPVYRYLDIAAKVQRRIALSAPPETPLRLEDDGSVWANAKKLFPPSARSDSNQEKL